jgi:NADPH:quinone reductase-like Zn-dependent oxidoreductase
VLRAGICGTDVELFTGQLAYFGQGKTRFPVRPGHEWCGVVSAVGAGVPAAGLGPAIEHYASGRVDPSGLAAVTIGLDRAAEALAGRIGTGSGTKIHVDPRRAGVEVS